MLIELFHIELEEWMGYGLLAWNKVFYVAITVVNRIVKAQAYTPY